MPSIVFGFDDGRALQNEYEGLSPLVIPCP